MGSRVPGEGQKPGSVPRPSLDCCCCCCCWYAPAFHAGAAPPPLVALPPAAAPTVMKSLRSGTSAPPERGPAPRRCRCSQQSKWQQRQKSLVGGDNVIRECKPCSSAGYAGKCCTTRRWTVKHQQRCSRPLSPCLPMPKAPQPAHSACCTAVRTISNDQTFSTAHTSTLPYLEEGGVWRLVTQHAVACGHGWRPPTQPSSGPSS